MKKEYLEEYQKFVESVKNEVSRLTEGRNAKVKFQPAQEEESEDYLVVEMALESGIHMQKFHMKEIFSDLKSGKLDQTEILAEVEDTLDYCKEVEKAYPFDEIGNYCKVCSRLIIRPLNYKNHTEQLNSGVYDRVGDIALVLYINLGTIKEQYVSTMVPFTVFSAWGQEKEAVMKAALKNTYDLFPPRVFDIFQLSCFGEEMYSEFMDQEVLPMDVDREWGVPVTNTNQVNGAITVFLPGVAKKLGELLKGDFYIAFTSIHEAIVHKIGTVEVEAIRCSLDMVKEGLESEDDFLSAEVYRYSRERDIIEVVE